MSVKVAVRVRPFNGREKELNSQLCVEMVGATTTITNPEDNKTKNFSFDFSFWSHDGFETDEKGYFYGVDSKYADQQHVYDLVGKEVLDNAWEGYHCCLFAYGQTGAGKSYSMVGYGANKGIVPISMQQIFERIAQNTNSEVSFEVCFSMLEIYNEKIQDLLVPVKDRVQEGLKVREHQKYGVYVDGLSRHPVDSYEAIEAKMDDGSKNRTIGSTLMNASSSRAHTIMTIEFKKIEVINGKKTEKFAVINLVDLAGSEKISKTGAAGDRLKEGCAINKSLSTLGLVISKLADKALGKKSVVVPYRDSALTRILQNALGGNSKTLMICALSPATDNYEETLSTLRYADQAKKIKNNAVINESEQDKMIRELREENEKLKGMLKDFNPASGEAREGFQMIDEETLRKFKEMEEQLKANAFMMQQYDKTFEEKLAEAKAKETSAHEKDVDTTQPYLMNLNEDPLLSGKVLHSLAKEKILIGKKNADPSPDIVLGGIGIKTKHAEIINKDGKITLSPCDRECGERLYVNGQKIYESVELAHNDRVIIGTNTTFLVKYPGKEDESPNANRVNETEVDWEFAQTELVEALNKDTKIKLDEGNKEREKEVEEKIKLIEEKFQKEKQANDDVLSLQKEEYEKKLQELEEKMKRETEKQKIEMEKSEAEREWNEQIARYEADLLMKEKERERMQKEIQEEATLQRFKEQEKVHLEHKLAKHLSQITEVNLIAKELKRDVTFSVRLTYNFVTGSEVNFYDKPTKTKIQVFVQNKETNNQYTWPMSKFTNRYFIIRDLLEQHYEGNKLPDKNTSEDPFWDPPEAHLIGQGFSTLESLAYLMDNPAELHLVNDNGTIGKLNVNIVPIDENGEPFNEDDNFIEDPSELMGKKLDFLVIIEDAELSEAKCQDTYCEYSLMKDDLTFETFQTPIVKGVHAKPDFKYKGQHSFSVVNDKILNYLLNHNLKLQIFGSNIVEEKPVAKGSNTSSPSTKSFKARNKNLQIATDSDDETANKKPQAQTPQIIYQQSYQAGVSMTPMNMGNRQEIEDVPVRRQTAGKAMEMLKAANQASNAGKGKEASKQGKDKDCNMF